MLDKDRPGDENRTKTDLISELAILRQNNLDLENKLKENSDNIVFLNEQLKQEIDERNIIEESLQNINALIEQILNTTPNIIYIYDYFKRTNIYSNQEITTMLGYTPEEVQESGNAFLDNLIHPDDIEQVESNRKNLQSKQNGELIETEYRIKDKNGKWQWISSREIIFSRSSSGEPLQILCSAQNITERKNAEHKLIYHLSLEECLSKVSSLFASANNIDINQALEIISTTLNISQSYMYLLTDHNKMIKTNSWLKWEKLRNLAPDHFYLQEYSLSLKILSDKNSTFILQDARLLPENLEKGKAILDKLQIKSAISIPIISKQDENIGLICLADTEKSRKWTEPEIRLLKVITEIISNYLERKKSREEILKLNSELENKVNERTAALKMSNDDLQQFAHIASHDLQEPLRMISSYLGLLKRKYSSNLDQNANEYIEFAVDGSKRMHELLNALLNYSKVDRENKKFTQVDCSTILVNVINNLQLVIADANAQITYKDLPVINANEIQIMQLFQNLISNSIKYNSQSIPKINISAVKQNDYWKFAVHDNGIGIQEKDFERIFIVFQRLHSRNEYSGTGMGLSICKKIIEKHKGEIWVESNENEGSTFFFTIPV